MDSPTNKYKSFKPINIKDRNWPNQVISDSPDWCSVDLRDGNQALIEPMGAERKDRMFKLLCDIGFKEIEVGFPSASQTDYDFVRDLIDNKKIPSDVTIQVLTQSREELIIKTFEALKGIPKAIVHFYNSTSTLQRRVVFNQDKKGIKDIATNGAKLIKKLAAQNPDTEWSFEYSPESFTGTELEYACEVCDEVTDILKDSSKNKIIINLPATVEMSTPNIYGDQIEWMHNNLKNRDKINLSLHPHNDRGTAVAAAELGVMAGADRVEGTLFGNGERTGNVDLITLGLNLFTQGINPQIDFSDINSLIETAEYCNRLPIHERHPYAGKLVHTAFSGSHQDAIRKGMDAIEKSNSQKWEVPYLPIDPADIGRTYEAIIRVNSQSGKGGSAWILETEHHIKIPKQAEIELSKYVQKLADTSGLEISSNDIWEIFQNQFIKNDPFRLINFVSKASNKTSGLEIIQAEIQYKGRIDNFTSEGNGPISAFVNGIRENYNLEFTLKDFGQNTRSATSKAESAAYVELKDKNDQSIFGCGIHTSITLAPILAVISAINKLN